MPPQSEDFEHMSATLGFLPGPKMAQNVRGVQTLHEHFAQACQGREALDALVDAGSSMSFAELQSRSTLLARQLIEATQDYESKTRPIAICIDGFSRSTWGSGNSLCIRKHTTAILTGLIGWLAAWSRCSLS